MTILTLDSEGSISLASMPRALRLSKLRFFTQGYSNIFEFYNDDGVSAMSKGKSASNIGLECGRALIG